MASQDTFEEDLRRALAHLYDPAFLRQSPLVESLGLQASKSPTTELQQLLLTGIEDLRPLPDAPRHSVDYQYARVLTDRYVHGFMQSSVALDLGVSTRHLRRIQAQAIHTLASALSERHSRFQEILPAHAPDGGEAPSALDCEFAWIGKSMAEEWTAVEPAMAQALRLARNVAGEQAVDLKLDASPTLPHAVVPGVVLEQIILGMVGALVRAVPGGSVALCAEPQEEGVTIRAGAQPAGAMWLANADWDRESLAVSCRLAELFSGSVSVRREVDALYAEAWLPSGQQLTVLAVEDNLDTLRLWERYLDNSRFRLVAVSNSEQAWASVIECSPSVIVLDVMLPDLDGWRFLEQLRYHPATSRIPVILCTVLPQKEVALSLGASGFIQKPVTRQAFRGALESLVEPVSRPS